MTSRLGDGKGRRAGFIDVTERREGDGELDLSRSPEADLHNR